MKILGIETSCDDTSVAIVEDGRKILANVISSQIDIHNAFGGVVPEIASRCHLEFLIPTIEEALEKASLTMDDIDAVACTNRPGLIGALIVGVSAAKAIALSKNIPLIGIHHLEGHIYANWLMDEEIIFPCVCLVVSGGHSDIIYMKDHGQYEIMARTRDDAAGECFDKSARALGLGYPGGPIIDKYAQKGNPKAIIFPKGRIDNSLDFSFSGLKTAVLRYIEKNPDYVLEDVCASLEKDICDVLVKRTFEVSKIKQTKQILVAGGVAANSMLQRMMRERAEAKRVNICIPKPILCTDNAAMVASAAFFNYERGLSSGLDLDAIANEPLMSS
ncbi:MAG: tRNA (adenosine(37)-N6)-threonylcarbamoyltransferase complex transferase subunit TsaD [Abditibacteriota bacterium]|nr:tRNA (adenosine(37)-N6)-threonylcarbamoyltransferase complex transferase subunit TsaD [Abditibacteriota bacterium]